MTAFDNNGNSKTDPTSSSTSDQHNRKKSLFTRSGFEQITDGDYTARTLGASIVNTNSGERLRLVCEFYNQNNDILRQSFLVEPDWEADSPFRSLLDATETLPEVDEDVNLQAMVGQELLLTMKITTFNGRKYLNLVRAEALTDEIDDEFIETDEMSDDEESFDEE